MIITFVIPIHLQELIDYVIEYVGNATDDWFVIKRELVNSFPPKERSRFSRRHYSPKKHILNEFDQEVINYWEERTATTLIIDETKLHPDNWKQRPSGWGLKAFNEARRKQKEDQVSN